jgi:hypothetical protein
LRQGQARRAVLHLGRRLPGDGRDRRGGRVTAGFDTRAALGSFDLAIRGTALAGAYELAGDKGTASFVRSGPALATDAMTPRTDLTPAEWRDDLATFARELPRRHANAFFSLPRAEFDAAMAALAKRADTANGDEMFVGLQAIAKSIGDGHTGLVSPEDRRVMPPAVGKFGDDFRITATGPATEQARGAKILAVGGCRSPTCGSARSRSRRMANSSRFAA